MNKMTKTELREFRINNLRRSWPKKGECRNPRGRRLPKEVWKYIARLQAPDDTVEVMLRKFALTRKKVTFEEAILIRLAYEASKGDMKAIEIWVDRQYGKVPQNMDLNLPPGPLVAILNAPQGGQTIEVTTTPPQALTPPAPKTQETQDPY